MTCHSEDGENLFRLHLSSRTQLSNLALAFPPEALYWTAAYEEISQKSWKDMQERGCDGKEGARVEGCDGNLERKEQFARLRLPFPSLSHASDSVKHVAG